MKSLIFNFFCSLIHYVYVGAPASDMLFHLFYFFTLIYNCSHLAFSVASVFYFSCFIGIFFLQHTMTKKHCI